MKITVHTDGGSRGNPGEAAIGIDIVTETGETHKVGKRIGVATNNIAEYTAVHEALSQLEKKYETCEVEATFYLDSELVVKQLTGLYKVKDKNLYTMYEAIREKSMKFCKIQFIHVLREKNKEADLLVNQALDNKI